VTRLQRVTIAPGVTLRADGVPSRLRGKPALRYALRRMYAAIDGDPTADLHLLPRASVETVLGDPPAEGHNLYHLIDRHSDVTVTWSFDIIEPQSDDWSQRGPELLIAACEAAGLDHRPAVRADTPRTLWYDNQKLKAILRDHLRREARVDALLAESHGEPADVVEGIAAGWPEGKAFINWRDGIEPIGRGFWFEVHASVHAPEQEAIA
jgi:hypothetical protein